LLGLFLEITPKLDWIDTIKSLQALETDELPRFYQAISQFLPTIVFLVRESFQQRLQIIAAVESYRR
jgi:hypothetical protein